MTQLNPFSFVAKRRRLVSNLALKHLKDQAPVDGTVGLEQMKNFPARMVD